jgi:hypothetical protein
LENVAESIEETALNDLPETAQSLENQALANELEDLAESAEKLAEELASNQPHGDEEIAGELNAIAEETTDLIEENPSFAELQNQAEEFSAQAGQTEESLSQLAEDLAGDAQATQEVAESSGEAAEQAKADMQAAQSEANEAAREAENLAQASEEAAQALENGTGSQNQASDAADNAAQLAAVAKRAEEAFEKAQEQAQTDSNLANESIAEAEQAAKQAEESADLAAAANELLDQFSETPPLNELANTDLPGAGMALNEVANALENQLEALENLQSGENINPFPDTTESKLEEFQTGQSTAESPENFASAEDAFDSSTPFSDQEVSQVLAQTLDTLDQAIFSTENPFNEPANSFPSESPPSGEPLQSASMEPTTPGNPKVLRLSQVSLGNPYQGMDPDPVQVQWHQRLPQSKQSLKHFNLCNWPRKLTHKAWHNNVLNL